MDMYIHVCTCMYVCSLRTHVCVYSSHALGVTVERGCMDRCVYIAVERGCVHTCIRLIPRLSSVCMHALLWCKGQQTNVCSRGGASLACPGYLHGYITGYGSTLYIGIDMVFCIPPIHYEIALLAFTFKPF